MSARVAWGREPKRCTGPDLTEGLVAALRGTAFAYMSDVDRPPYRPSTMVHLALSTRSIALDHREIARRIPEMGKERVRVADVMIVDAIVVSRDATLEEADIIIRSSFVTGLPVVDGEGVLVGVIGHAQLAANRFGRLTGPSEQAPRSRHRRGRR